MDQRDAEIELTEAEVVPALQGSMTYIKDLCAQLLDADIPASVGRPPGDGPA